MNFNSIAELFLELVKSNENITTRFKVLTSYLYCTFMKIFVKKGRGESKKFREILTPILRKKILRSKV